MERIGRGKVIVHAIEEVLLVAFVVKDLELRRIEKAPGVQAVNLEEITPLFAAVREIKAGRRRSEGAVGAAEAAGGPGDAHPGAGGGHDHQTGLVAILAGGAPLMTSMD